MGRITKLSDEDILKRYLEKQSDSYFQMLYGRYIHKVYGKAISLLKDEALAEDATQEIFLKIFLNLSKFTFKSKFSTWVYSITYNYCIDLIRKQKKKKNLFVEDSDRIPDVEEDSKNEKQLLEMEFTRLEVVLHNIPIEDRAVLLMKYQDSMGIKDISHVIGKSESAVKMKIKRAKAKAKKVYQKLYPTEHE